MRCELTTILQDNYYFLTQFPQISSFFFFLDLFVFSPLSFSYSHSIKCETEGIRKISSRGTKQKKEERGEKHLKE